MTKSTLDAPLATSAYLNKPLRTEAEVRAEREPMCADFDSDCAGVTCKVTCWLYDSERGWCPYLLGTAPEAS
jgi:hypothetical protein